MKQENKRLGRGLSALLSNKDNTHTSSNGYKNINITSLKANKKQPRNKCWGCLLFAIKYHYEDNHQWRK